ncbi:MAG: CbiX/SirB N-terminal domain-containing protein [Candidatus Aminicenantales bacterium]
MADKNAERPKAVIVLAMHGAPPLDFPREEMTEFMSLHARVGHAPVPDAGTLRQRYEELEAKMRVWPRTGQNDPFYAGSQDLAKHLRRESGLEVIVGFNEFCAPTLDEVLERAAAREAGRIIVVTPMMTRGGEHSAVDIPKAIRRAQQKYPDQKFVYAWPFPTEDIARFLSSQITRFL